MVFRHLLNSRFFLKGREDSGAGFLVALLYLAILPTFCSGQHAALDLEGRSVNPLNWNTGQVVVLVFVREGCPVSGRYAPTIQRISEAHQKDARFYLVFPDRSESSSTIRNYLKDFGYSIPGLRDPDRALV